MKSPRNGNPSKKWTMGLLVLLSFFAVSALSAFRVIRSLL